MKNCLLLFVLMSFALIVRGQSTCSEAVIAGSGTNTLPATPDSYWYHYTLPSDGKLQITSSSSEHVTIYSNSCDDLWYEGYGQGNVTATTLASGEEVFIQWDTSEGFDWDVSVVPLGAGDNCALAVAATSGTNTLPATPNTYYWYTYTMPSDGKLHINSPFSEYVEVFSNTCGALNDEGYGYGRATATTLSSGEEVFIRWETAGEGNFDWTLSVSPSEPGDDCTLATTAVAGTNTLPETLNSYYWYTYTMPIDGKLQINSSTSNYLNVYKNTCETWNYEEYGQGNATVTTLTSGDVVYIRWRTRYGSNFDWNLSVNPLEPGDDCELAVTAASGTNTLPPTLNAEYWYTYTMPSDGKLVITSSSDKYVEFYSNTCGALNDEAGGNGNVTTTSFTSGDNVFIKWYLGGEGNFDWDLSVSPLGPGDNCELAVTATAGTNTTPAAPYWFEYTAPATAEYTISSVGMTTEDTYLRVYSDCSSPLLDASDDHEDFQSELTLSLTAGETISILWDDDYSSAAFDWTLSSEALNKASQAITFNSLPTKTLADATFELTATASSGLPVSYASSDENVATVSGSTVTIIGAGTATITATQTGDDSYYVAEPVAQVLTVNKVSQTITVEAIANQLVDAPPITVTASTTSGLSLSYAVRGPALMSGNELTLTGSEGTVTVTVSQAGDDYYRTARASVSFTVTDPSLQDQTITFDPLPAKESDDAPFELTAMASSNLAVSFTSSNEAVATVSGNTVTIVGAGTTTITARQAGNDTYRAASVAQVLTVNGFAQTATCSGLTASVTETNGSCHGTADGSLTIVATGGTAPYRYSLDGTTFQEEGRFVALDSGTYEVTVEDANGCSTTVAASITVPDALVINGQSNPSTTLAGNGSITVSMSGGTAPYQYIWTNNATTATINNLTLGEYQVTVTDAAGCTMTTSFAVGAVTAVEELPKQQITVYPNPVRDVLYIDLPAESEAQQATLYTLMGRKVTELSLTEGRNQMEVKELKPGSYLLRLDNGSSRRLIVR